MNIWSFIWNLQNEKWDFDIWVFKQNKDGEFPVWDTHTGLHPAGPGFESRVVFTACALCSSASCQFDKNMFLNADELLDPITAATLCLYYFVYHDFMFWFSELYNPPPPHTETQTTTHWKNNTKTPQCLRFCIVVQCRLKTFGGPKQSLICGPLPPLRSHLCLAVIETNVPL